jgi:hypothetical protein
MEVKLVERQTEAWSSVWGYFSSNNIILTRHWMHVEKDYIFWLEATPSTTNANRKTIFRGGLCQVSYSDDESCNRQPTMDGFLIDLLSMTPATTSKKCSFLFAFNSDGSIDSSRLIRQIDDCTERSSELKRVDNAEADLMELPQEMSHSMVFVN